jgi:D-aminopeptidase
MEPDDETQPAAEESPATDERATDADDGLEKWKGLARKHETQAKANADKAKAYDELVAQLTGAKSEADKAKSEAATLAERIAALEKDNKEATQSALRARIANTKGVPEALLSGDTKEALEASADELLAWRGDKPAVPTTNMQGKQGDPISGAKQVTKAELDSMSLEQVNKALADGRLGDLLTGKQ